MHTITEIKVLRDEFEKAVEGYRTSVLTNKEYPLEDRWNAYLEIEKFLPNDPYGEGFIQKLDLESLYDDFYMERYQTMHFSEMLDRLREKVYEAIEYPDDYSNHIIKAEPLIPAWEEAILASGYGSFTNDW